MHRTMGPRKIRATALALMLGASMIACSGGGGGDTTVAPPPPPPPPAVNGPAWLGYGGAPQHAALAAIQTQALNKIVWQAPVDVAPRYTTQGYLLVHYGSPAITSVLVNSEDGFLYRWDLTTNTLSQKIRLTSGLGESYTPTAVGADGLVYAINNAVLFAVGR